MGRKYNLTGNRYGLLMVLSDSGERSKDGTILWECLCDCGVIKKIRTQALVCIGQKSCGCTKSKNISMANRKHGMYESRLYRIWDGMKQRCYNSSHRNFKHYGGKGVSIAEVWINFDGFMKWSLANGYKENLTIDRINVDGNYEPDNCRWVTQLVQTRNKTNTIWVEYEGEKACLMDITDKIPVNHRTVRDRLRRGVPKEYLLLSKEEFKTRKKGVS